MQADINLKRIGDIVRKVEPGASITIFDGIDAPNRVSVKVSWHHRGSPTAVTHIMSKAACMDAELFEKEMQILARRIKEAQSFLKYSELESGYLVPASDMNIAFAISQLNQVADWLDSPTLSPALSAKIGPEYCSLGYLIRRVMSTLEHYTQAENLGGN